MASYLLLLLPALALASIDVEVIGKYGDDNSNMKVYFAGSESDIISKEDRATFKLGDETLKNAVRSYFGATPDNVYLRSPTPWGDLYKSYGWSQVLKSLVPQSARIVKITSQPEIVMKKVFENNSSKPALFNVGIHQTLESTVSSSWSHSEELKIDQDIKYNFELMNGGKSSFSYTSKYGQDYKKSKAVTVGATSAMELLLQPGQSAEATLEVTKGNILVEIEYEASLSGSVAVHYSKTYKGHNFWSLDVRGVMESGNLSNKVRAKEIIEISFYGNSKVVVNDKFLGNKLMEVQF